MVVKIRDIKIGDGNPIVLIAGPCVIEGKEICFGIAEKLKEIAGRLDIGFIFKSSYDKSNRSSITSHRGPGLEDGIKVLEFIKEKLDIPVTSDVHCKSEIDLAGKVLDVIQIPAYLCRQTDLILEAAKTRKVVNVKKGQFMAPWDMKNVVEKVKSTGNNRILLTERGTSFGYNNLVVDMRSIPEMRKLGVPVIFDATHSVQLPAGEGVSSGGDAGMIPYLARAAAGCGVDGIFMEVHENPDRALCDGPNMVKLENVEEMLKQIIQIDMVVKKRNATVSRK